MAKHTPGPWVYVNGLQIWQDGPSAIESSRICTLTNANKVVRQLSAEEQTANAHLIAAAPELLAMLVEVLECGPNVGGNAGVLQNIEALIAKATGGAE